VSAATTIRQVKGVLAPPAQRGFTLLELMLVIFIMGMVAALVFPRIPNMGGGNLKHEVRALSGYIGGLYAEATFTRKPHRLVFDLDTQSYWAESGLPPAEPGGAVSYGPVDHTFLHPVELPQGVKMLDVEVPLRGKRSDGHAFTYFSPLGRADYAVVHMRSGNETVTLEVNPFSGRVVVVDGYVEASGK